jgi:hypothetical protein
VSKRLLVRGVVACALSIAIVAAASRALADGDAGGTGAHARIVDVVIVGPPDDARALESSLRELLERLGLEMRASRADMLPADRAAIGDDVAARVWIDLREGDVAHVEIVARGASVKRDVAREGTRTVLLEDVAHVVQATTESILTNIPRVERDAGAPLDAAPPPDAPVEAVAPPPPRSHEDAGAPSMPPSGPTVGVATFASVAPFASSSVVFGAGAGARVGFRETWHPALWITGAYHAPFGHDGEPLDLHVSVWSARALGTAGLVDAGRFSMEAGAGGGVDVFVLSPGAASAGATVDASRTDVSPILTGILTARYAMSTTASAFLALTVDFDLRPRKYVVTDGDSRSALVSPFVMRPGLALGLSFDVVGARSSP